MDITSKEALNNLRFAVSIAQDLPYKECNDLCDIIEQDLERLEMLEKENKKWREIVGCDLCEALGREILLEENEKLKKAIEILKKIVSIPLEDDFAKVKIDKETKEETLYYALSIKYLIDEQEYELLKEVINNE